MITNINKFKSVNENNSQIKETTILFTDIKDSSKHWAVDEEEMFEALNILEKMINKIINKHKGMVVKTIGDSFMVSYDNDKLLDGIKTAIDIQKEINKTPITVGGNKLTMRIGICYGDIYIKESLIQGAKLKDYYGNTVGTASRMESKVSDINGFAFSILNGLENNINILKYLEQENIDIKVIEYDNKCNKDQQRNRSGRLLTDLQINSCKNPKDLKGVKDVRVYKCNLNL